MDVIVGAIKDAKKESDFEKLKKELNNRIDYMYKYASQLNGALASLQNKKNTLGVVFLLYVKTLMPNVDHRFISQVESLLQDFDVEQARKTEDKFGLVVHRYTKVLLETNPTRGIPLIKNALVKFRLSSDNITPLHSDYVSLCLKAQNYKAALWLLETRIFQVNPKRSGCTPRDLLLYYYYGGMIYTGLKKYNQARQFFETVLNAPANTVTAIMVEAYKKYILVSLLSQGKASALSGKASPIFRHLKAYTSEYLNLSSAYETYSVDKVSEVVAKHKENFQKDDNYGLVKQCIQALYRLNIQRLTQTYLTLSLENIAETVGLKNAEEAELRVLEMVERGEIIASINKEAGMVEFKDRQNSFSSPGTSQLLENRISTSADLASKLRNMDNDIASSKSFIAHSHGLREEILPELEQQSSNSGRIGRVLDIFRA
eukprot:gb/GECH01009215.1/.p1 GENE.gb/GECH01009215.1/~~gb/GECH01009215.1/.p1  ORF type:complete len:430 (+),score=68.39 gb/GECH01009215.1/:1-1290(+)